MRWTKSPGMYFQTQKGQEGVIMRSQHWFMRKKSWLTNLSEATSLIDKARTVHVIYLNFSKASDTLSHNTLIEKSAISRLVDSMVDWKPTEQTGPEGCDK